MRRIKEKEMNEDQVRKAFYDFTKNFIDYSMNSSNLIDYANEDKVLLEGFESKANKWKKTFTYILYSDYVMKTRDILKVIFSEKYMDVLGVLNNFVEKKNMNDFDMLKDYSVMVDVL